MKTLLLTGALFAATATGSTFAADLPAAPVVPVVAPRPAPVYSWTGCFAGLEGGAVFGQSRHTSVGPATSGDPITNSFSVDGGLAGGAIGCNYQVNSIVVGIENDVFWTNARGSSNDIPPFVAGTVSSTKESWLDTVRGRVGFAWKQFFLYGTAGAAIADVGVNVCTPAGFCDSQSQTRAGWVAGAGVEVATWITPSGTATIKLEYLHADLSYGGAFFSPAVPIGTSRIVSRDVSLNTDMLVAGVNWKFNLFEPSLTRPQY
jgi:outer membrane immunogenic protein